MSNFGRLELLEPYDPTKDLCALTDASYLGLAFILFQKRSDGNWSIVQVGSTTLKGSQLRWHLSELEALAIDYLFSKSHFITFCSAKTVDVYSDCSGLKNFETLDIHNIKNRRLLAIKERLQSYNYRVLYIAGARNEMADALSRTPVYFDSESKPKTLDFDSVRNLYLHEGADGDSEYCRRLDAFSIEVLQAAPEIKKYGELWKKLP